MPALGLSISIAAFVFIEAREPTSHPLLDVRRLGDGLLVLVLPLALLAGLLLLVLVLAAAALLVAAVPLVLRLRLGLRLLPAIAPARCRASDLLAPLRRFADLCGRLRATCSGRNRLEAIHTMQNDRALLSERAGHRPRCRYCLLPSQGSLPFSRAARGEHRLRYRCRSFLISPECTGDWTFLGKRSAELDVKLSALSNCCPPINSETMGFSSASCSVTCLVCGLEREMGTWEGMAAGSLPLGALVGAGGPVFCCCDAHEKSCGCASEPDGTIASALRPIPRTRSSRRPCPSPPPAILLC